MPDDEILSVEEWRAKEARAREAALEGIVCPQCRQPVNWTYENDYICDTHGFVDALRPSDGALLSGDGQCGSVRVIGNIHDTERP